MSSERLCALLAALLLGSPVQAQSTLERSANLSGGWLGASGQAHFHFLHRFDRSDAPLRKVSSSPTFLLGYGARSWLLLGAQYASASTLVARYPNEWELFVRAGSRAGAAHLSGQGGYNVAARSLDVAADAARGFGPLRVLASARFFSNALDRDEARVAAGAGATLRVGGFALAGDVVSLLSSGADAAWSAALQWRIPMSPHSLSLHVTNANTGTLQGSSVGTDRLRYGFEFTVPLTPRRYLGRAASAAVPQQSGAVAAAGDTVVVRIAGMAFQPARLRVAPGTLVRWVNEDPFVHTVTAKDGSWDSGLIEPGGSYQRVFSDEGSVGYTCAPHPVMEGEVTIAAGAP